MKIDFDGKRMMVVGAASGIGAATVRCLSACGARVWAADIVCTAMPASYRALKIDVTNEASVRAAFAQVGSEGPLHGLIYVAGGVLGQSAKPLEQVTLEDWQRIVDVNLNGAFLCAREAVGGMKRQGVGRIVVVSSGAGLAASLTDMQSYCAAKHGEVGLVKQLARELAPFGVTVNSVAPGFIVSGPDAERQWTSWSSARQEAYMSTRAGKRMGTPDDIAYSIAFLASDYASWITGQTLPVTGAPI